MANPVENMQILIDNIQQKQQQGQPYHNELIELAKLISTQPASEEINQKVQIFQDLVAKYLQDKREALSKQMQDAKLERSEKIRLARQAIVDIRSLLNLNPSLKERFRQPLIEFVQRSKVIVFSSEITVLEQSYKKTAEARKNILKNPPSHLEGFAQFEKNQQADFQQQITILQEKISTLQSKINNLSPDDPQTKAMMAKLTGLSTQITQDNEAWQASVAKLKARISHQHQIFKVKSELSTLFNEYNDIKTSTEKLHKRGVFAKQAKIDAKYASARDLSHQIKQKVAELDGFGIDSHQEIVSLNNQQQLSVQTILASLEEDKNGIWLKFMTTQTLNQELDAISQKINRDPLVYRSLQALASSDKAQKIINDDPALKQKFSEIYNKATNQTTNLLIAADIDRFKKIGPYEMYQYHQRTKKDFNPELAENVSNFINHSTNLTYFIVEDIVSRSTNEERILAIEYWLQVAKKSLNHPTTPDVTLFFAIQAALSKSSITRLEAFHTINKLKGVNSDILNLNFLANNYSKYLQYIDKHPHAIPFIAPYLSFMTFAQDGNTGSNISLLPTFYDINNNIRNRREYVKDILTPENNALAKLIKPIKSDAEIDNKLYKDSQTIQRERIDEEKFTPKERTFMPYDANINSEVPSFPKSSQAVKQSAQPTVIVLNQDMINFHPYLQSLGLASTVVIANNTSEAERNNLRNEHGLDLQIEQDKFSLDQVSQEYNIRHPETKISKNNVFDLQQYANDLFAEDKANFSPKPRHLDQETYLVDHSPTLKVIATIYLMLNNPNFFRPTDEDSDKEKIAKRDRVNLTQAFIEQLSPNEFSSIYSLLQLADSNQPDKKVIDIIPTTFKTLFEEIKNSPNTINTHEISQKLPDDMSKYTYVKGKPGGSHQPGPLGGVYSIPASNVDSKFKFNKAKKVLLLFKQERNKKDKHRIVKDMAEFASGKIFNALIGDTASSVILAKSNNSVKLPDEDGKNIYIGSVFYENFKELFKEMGFDERVGFLELRNGNAFIKAFCEFDDNGKIIGPKFAGFFEGAVSSLLIGDFDLHAGNYGIVSSSDETMRRLVKIDHGAGLNRLENALHIHSKLRHLPGFGPINFLDLVPRQLKINPLFADEALRQSKVDLSPKIEEGIDELAKYYGKEPLLKFAKHIGYPIKPYKKLYAETKLTGEANEQLIAEGLITKQLIGGMKDFLKTKIQARQQSLRELAFEIQLSSMIKKTLTGYEFIDVEYIDKENNKKIIDFDQLIKNFPAEILKVNGKFHLRGEDQAKRIHLGLLSFKLPGSTPKQLSEKINKEVDKNLNAIVANAISAHDPKVIEYLLTNNRYADKYKHNSVFAQSVDSAYQAIINDLTQQYITNHDDILKEVKLSILTEEDKDKRQLVVERWGQIMAKATAENRPDLSLAIHNALHDKAIASKVKLDNILEQAKQPPIAPQATVVTAPIPKVSPIATEAPKAPVSASPPITEATVAKTESEGPFVRIPRGAIKEPGYQVVKEMFDTELTFRHSIKQLIDYFTDQGSIKNELVVDDEKQGKKTLKFSPKEKMLLEHFLTPYRKLLEHPYHIAEDQYTIKNFYDAFVKDTAGFLERNEGSYQAFKEVAHNHGAFSQFLTVLGLPNIPDLQTPNFKPKDILITPIQRAPRYELLFTEWLKKAIKENDPYHYQKMTEQLEILQESTRKINQFIPELPLEIKPSDKKEKAYDLITLHFVKFEIRNLLEQIKTKLNSDGSQPNPFHQHSINTLLSQIHISNEKFTVEDSLAAEKMKEVLVGLAKQNSLAEMVAYYQKIHLAYPNVKQLNEIFLQVGLSVTLERIHQLEPADKQQHGITNELQDAVINLAKFAREDSKDHSKIYKVNTILNHIANQTSLQAMAEYIKKAKNDPALINQTRKRGITFGQVIKNIKDQRDKLNNVTQRHRYRAKTAPELVELPKEIPVVSPQAISPDAPPPVPPTSASTPPAGPEREKKSDEAELKYILDNLEKKLEEAKILLDKMSKLMENLNTSLQKKADLQPPRNDRIAASDSDNSLRKGSVH